jgi:cytochrome c-type biogenesis protein
MSKKIAIYVFGIAILAVLFYFGRQVWLNTGGALFLPLAVFAAALADSINPCAISVLLITIAFLFSLGRDRKAILRFGGVYIAGIFITYILIGLGIINILQFFGAPHFMTRLGAVVIILWGVLSILDDLIPNFPIKLKIPQFAHRRIALLMEKGSLVASFAVGVLVGLTEFPCTGGPYLFILGLLHDQTEFATGFAYLIFYNIIFVLPLVIILVMGSDRELLEKVKTWKGQNGKVFSLVASTAMILLGLVVFLI